MVHWKEMMDFMQQLIEVFHIELLNTQKAYLNLIRHFWNWPMQDIYHHSQKLAGAEKLNQAVKGTLHSFDRKTAGIDRNHWRSRKFHLWWGHHHVLHIHHRPWLCKQLCMPGSIVGGQLATLYCCAATNAGGLEPVAHHFTLTTLIQKLIFLLQFNIMSSTSSSSS